MARSLASYKGLWRPQCKAEAEPAMSRAGATAAPTARETMEPAAPNAGVKDLAFETAVPSASLRMESSPGLAYDDDESREPAAKSHLSSFETDLLSYRYRLLVLAEQRQKLGLEALDAAAGQRPWQVASVCLLSGGASFRTWAHARLFALSCRLGVGMSPDILQSLRHPIHWRRYRRTLSLLHELFDRLAEKSGRKPLPQTLFKVCAVCPPAVLWLYERQLQRLLRRSESDPQGLRGTAFAGSAQGQ